MTDWLLEIPPLAVYLCVGLVVGVESIGIPLPGETLLVAAALLASQGTVSPVLVAGTAALGAAVGDSIGYLIGRRHGPRLLDFLARRSPRHLGPDRVEVAVRLMRRHGAWAVFFGRFMALLRILSGPLAGSLRMPYRTFALANWTGAAVWAGTTTTVVYLLGEAAEALLREVAWGGVALLVLVALVAVLLLRRRRRRNGHRPTDGAATGRSSDRGGDAGSPAGEELTAGGPEQ